MADPRPRPALSSPGLGLQEHRVRPRRGAGALLKSGSARLKQLATGCCSGACGYSPRSWHAIQR